MRIVAGSHRGRRLVAPRGAATRPTADRVKEAVFNILGPPAPREGARFRVLDLFAGSGALGLEALSRGADEVVLVDEDRHAVEAAARNIEAMGVAGQVQVLQREAGKALASFDAPFDWVFLDPPYQGGALDRALRLLGRSKLVAGVVIAEHESRTPPDDEYGRLALDDRRRYGDTTVSFYRPADAGDVANPPTASSTANGPEGRP